MVGGMHGDGICLAGGHVWQGICMVARGVHGTGGHVWQGSVHGKGGMHGIGPCVAAGVCLSTRRGGGGAGETATTADGTHPTGMHSCLYYFPE